MSYQEFVEKLTPDVVERLRRGIETGHWPDGRSVTPEQREHSLQAVIAWEREHLPEEERVGFIDKGHKGGADKSDAPSTLRWADQATAASKEEASNSE